MGAKTASVYRSRSLYLLLSLVLLMLMTPFFEGTSIGRLVVNGALSLVLLATVNAVSHDRRIQLTALALAVVSLVLLWTNVTDPLNPGRLAGLVLYIALSIVVIGLLLRHILVAPTVTFEILCAGIGLYLLIGVTWTLTYIVMDAINPDTFESLSPGLERGWTGFLYFSFVTLTTLGYGDISPNTPVAQIWAVSEAVTGVLYIAVLVARLVSLYRN